MRNPSLTSLSRPLAGLVSTLLLVLAPVGCRKEPGPPSAEYEQAHQRFSKLYAQKLDQAFLDPEMEEIEAQLQQVSPESLDAPSAKELLKRISDGRERMLAAQQETEDAIASTREVDSFPSSPQEEPSAPAPRARVEDGGTPDAGGSEGPEAGTAASELAAGFQGCFRRGEQVNVNGRGMREMWQMDDRYSCSRAYPRFAGQFLLIEDGRVAAVLPKSLLRLSVPGQDGGSPSSPDAGS